jgi:RNase H-fold protein (predicted Holliday junction resolvase)
MIIFAVDPGVKNMGFACYDTEKRAFLTFGNYDMMTGAKRIEKTKYALLTKRFCEAMAGLLEKSDVVVIEAQMQARMKVIQTALQCFYWNKSHVIGPLAVRKFFGISMSNYRLNKKTSVELAPFLIRTANEKKMFTTFNKKDDVSDAIILARYWDIKERGETWAKPTITATTTVIGLKRKRKKKTKK